MLTQAPEAPLIRVGNTVVVRVNVPSGLATVVESSVVSAPIGTAFPVDSATARAAAWGSFAAAWESPAPPLAARAGRAPRAAAARTTAARLRRSGAFEKPDSGT